MKSLLDKIHIKNLGEGGFGKLQLYKCKKYCINYNCNKCVVVKTMKKDNIFFESNKTFFINHFYNEFYMTINLKHPNIRKTLNIDKKNNTITFEYCYGIDLFDYLELYKENTKFLLHLYSQILDGVEYLHNNNIAHLDLKLENIMVYNNHIKIIDFGEAMFFKIDGKEILYKGIHGTEVCMPPEMIQRKLYKPSKVDIWCCGRFS
jgi:serine/threonine protein kinase